MYLYGLSIALALVSIYFLMANDIHKQVGPIEREFRRDAAENLTDSESESEEGSAYSIAAFVNRGNTDIFRKQSAKKASKEEGRTRKNKSKKRTKRKKNKKIKK